MGSFPETLIDPTRWQDFTSIFLDSGCFTSIQDPNDHLIAVITVGGRHERMRYKVVRLREALRSTFL